MLLTNVVDDWAFGPLMSMLHAIYSAFWWSFAESVSDSACRQQRKATKIEDVADSTFMA